MKEITSSVNVENMLRVKISEEELTFRLWEGPTVHGRNDSTMHEQFSCLAENFCNRLVLVDGNTVYSL